ncbi:MAG: hypothetical protein A2527_09490 [Candidatus Lambdaproteobacteria bacterium RIFOXYD2_FULL_50_16]|uniref:Uncharacterized protein n=1 Tax=Candidatus Lambdaproteobacteria bacterium RIFOXYD2_FULL_50_16 TaxID=1817772 RepID=A0A1F6G7H7_9PROT|nr:MAG: hypothetical protein A2527_09490 [Candidatus Lambdaproteobacteria bacterium RIFOXYD2_FULL_50_16]
MARFAWVINYFKVDRSGGPGARFSLGQAKKYLPPNQTKPMIFRQRRGNLTLSSVHRQPKFN